MPTELTAADMAEHQVTFAAGTGATTTRVFTAAYVVADDAKMPGMLVFKDYRHRAVAMVNAATVLTVERLERGENAPPAPQSGGVTLAKLPIPGAAGGQLTQTVHFPPEAWSSNR
jgi:hypothetical protein